jgi:hypothetical protein
MRTHLKLTLLFLLLISSAACALAQPYVRVGFGFAGAAGSEAVGQNTVYNGSTSTATYQNVNGSFGKGTSFDATFGETLSPIASLELEFSYTTGEQYSVNHTFVNTNVPAYNVTDALNGSLFALTPMLVLSTGSDGIAPYVRLGAIISLPDVSVTQSSADAPAAAVTSTGQGDYSGPAAVGYRASIGVKFPAEDRMSWYGELFYTGLGWQWNQYTFTDAAGNQSYYHYSGTNSPNNGYSLTVPHAPFGSIGAQVGIKYEL